MSNLRSEDLAAVDLAWRTELPNDAAALVRQFGPAGVEWLDKFLAEYIFDGEPLDAVMVKARELAGLPARPRCAFSDD